MSDLAISIPTNELAPFCRRWKISELALFGSALRADFKPASDLDFLVTFAADVNWGLLDHVRMQRELESILHRNVDLVSKRALEYSPNWIRRQEILNTARVLFSNREVTHATR